MVDVEALAGDLNSIAIHLVRRLRRADASLGITPARLSALSVLVFGGSCSLRALADAEQVSGPTMSRLVAALEDAGLVRRTRDAADGRAVVLTATQRGRRLMKRGRRQRVERLHEELRRLPDEDLAVLDRAVAILRTLE